MWSVKRGSRSYIVFWGLQIHFSDCNWCICQMIESYSYGLKTTEVLNNFLARYGSYLRHWAEAGFLRICGVHKTKWCLVTCVLSLPSNMWRSRGAFCTDNKSGLTKQVINDEAGKSSYHHDSSTAQLDFSPFLRATDRKLFYSTKAEPQAMKEQQVQQKHYYVEGAPRIQIKWSSC